MGPAGPFAAPESWSPTAHQRQIPTPSQHIACTFGETRRQPRGPGGSEPTFHTLVVSQPRISRIAKYGRVDAAILAIAFPDTKIPAVVCVSVQVNNANDFSECSVST